MKTAIVRLDSRLARFQCLSGNQLKMIAALCMLTDHVTKVFYQSLCMRIINPMRTSGQMSVEQMMVGHNIYLFLCGIGAVAFPVFAYLFTEGFRHTRSKPRYLLRLGALALLSELPFDLVFFTQGMRNMPGAPDWPWYHGHQNVFFTYLLALCALWLIETVQKHPSKFLSVPLQGLIVLAAYILGEEVIRGDAYGYGIVLILTVYFLRENRLYQVLGMAAVKLLMDRTWFPVSFLFSLGLILLYNGRRGEKKRKAFFYGFYPIHITVIGILDWLIFTLLWEALFPG